MHILTHGLASLALVRAGWPRAPKQLWMVAVIAGVIADADLASPWFGAAAWLTWRGTYTHSFLAALAIAAVCAAAYRRIASAALRQQFSGMSAVLLAMAASMLHLAMDLCGWEGLALLWPLSGRRFALDWVANLDPLLIAVLLGALLLPEFLHLVTSEIGARDQRPRGATGARIGFALLLLYLGLRANFHGNVLALMDTRTFAGEVAERVGAFPESLSPLTWHGIVETERGLHTLVLSTGPWGSFDPETAETLFKPEPSAALETARQTAVAKQFLRTARFPRASVDILATETRVELRDLRYDAAGADREVLAVIRLDSANRVLSQEMVWAAQ